VAQDELPTNREVVIPGETSRRQILLSAEGKTNRADGSDWGEHKSS
jgi:hypothetical protein